ncbi:hypothetical protein PITC_095000 [Penicillium italicum]|uniref:Uncharacterized protein n=1 Tax=Penicillium italicum TaxID=40296 RepID=A0A0A2KQW9_PENIT|nr:hypothetical protein PITC_095000 [Penicillium italicum]
MKLYDGVVILIINEISFRSSNLFAKKLLNHEQLNPHFETLVFSLRILIWS